MVNYFLPYATLLISLSGAIYLSNKPWFVYM